MGRAGPWRRGACGLLAAVEGPAFRLHLGLLRTGRDKEGRGEGQAKLSRAQPCLVETLY